LSDAFEGVALIPFEEKSERAWNVGWVVTASDPLSPEQQAGEKRFFFVFQRRQP